MEKKTGAKFAYLPYKSGGEAATQLVGNHTAANVNNPSENLEVWRAGQVRALCVFDKERIEYKTKVTDTISRGTTSRPARRKASTSQYLMLRAMFLPGKVTPEQTAFYVDLFKKLTQTAGIQGLHGKAGAQAGLPHRQGHAQVPRGGRHAEQEPDDRGRLRRERSAGRRRRCLASEPLVRRERKSRTPSRRCRLVVENLHDPTAYHADRN